MSSEIRKTDNMFSVRSVPWHKLGAVLDNPPTSEEAIRHARLDWTVAVEKIFAANGGGSYIEMPNAWATIRRDPEFGNIPLGVVGKRYIPLQNVEAFEFFDPLIKDGVAEYETAGSLFDGKKVWILAKMKENLLVGDGDSINKYVLLSNSHDGTSATTVKMTPVRVVCNNTLSAALRDKGAKQNEFSLRHTKSAKDKLKQAQLTLEAVNTAYDRLGKIWSTMASVELPRHERVKYVNHVFPERENSQDNKKLIKLRTEVLQLLSSGAGMNLETASGTLWGAYNAVTEHVTHNISARKGSTLETHVGNLWFGRLNDTLDRAFKVSLDMMEEKGIDVSRL